MRNTSPLASASQGLGLGIAIDPEHGPLRCKAGLALLAAYRSQRYCIDRRLLFKRIGASNCDGVPIEILVILAASRQTENDWATVSLIDGADVQCEEIGNGLHFLNEGFFAFYSSDAIHR